MGEEDGVRCSWLVNWGQEPMEQGCLRDQQFAKGSCDQFPWRGWLWLFCRQTVMIKELGEKREGTGTLCLVGEGCSEQGDSPRPFFKHKGCVPRGKERCGKGDGACYRGAAWFIGANDGGWNEARLDPARGLARGEAACEGLR